MQDANDGPLIVHLKPDAERKHEPNPLGPAAIFADGMGISPQVVVDPVRGGVEGLTEGGVSLRPQRRQFIRLYRN